MTNKEKLAEIDRLLTTADEASNPIEKYRRLALAIPLAMGIIRGLVSHLDNQQKTIDELQGVILNADVVGCAICQTGGQEAVQ